MTGPASNLIAASGLIITLLGVAHLVVTFRGSKLHPRDTELKKFMETVSPVITKETTMWKAWVGFNASHSFGAILFGLVYGYLALVHPEVLLSSAFLLGVGGAILGGYLFLGQRYWFSIPFRGILTAAVLYGAGVVAAFL